jgi:RNA polymerase sigma factor (sigma-70 family)
MNDERGDAVIREMIDRLNRGDERAALDIFETYGPYLRMVVRRRLSSPLRTKLDSEDIVQSVWADLIDVFRAGGDRFPDAEKLRAFLVRTTCNRLIDRHRQHATSLRLEHPASDVSIDGLAAAREDRPSEAIQADELWDRMLGSCPLAHRELLQMKRDGLALAEIAERSGLHPSSIRRIFYNLARRLGVSQVARGDEVTSQT